MPNQTIVVTGADGQLGQTLIKYLLDTQPHLKVIGTIRHKSQENKQYIFDLAKVTLDTMDLNDVHSIENIILKYQPRYFVNTAANAFVGESWALPAIHMQQNCLAVLHQLEAIRKHSPETRYVNMGTSEEFAVCDKGAPQNESTKIAPRSPYGCSKAAARYLVDVYRESYGLYAVQPWCFNFEGPLRGIKYLTRKTTVAVARIARAIKDGKPFEPLEVGNIYSYRSWQAAEDVADGIWRVLNQEMYRADLKGQTDVRELSRHVKPYVFSSEDTHDVKTFITKAFEMAGLRSRWEGQGTDERLIITCAFDSIIWVPEAPALVRINPAFYRPLDVTFLHGDATLARTELGWQPKVSFDQLVSRMVESELATVGL